MAICEFVPDPCSALLISKCIVNRECEINEFNTTGLKFAGDIGIEDLGQFQLRINDLNACIILGMIQAFQTAGCPVPDFGQAPDPPDLSECQEQLDDMIAEASNPIGYLDETFNLEFDEDGIPTKVVY